jgi:acetylornithine deacetylase
MVTPTDISKAVQARLNDATGFLSDLISIPSLSGQEQAAMACAEQAFSRLAPTERVELSNALRDDPDFSSPVEGIDYTGRWNLRAQLPGRGKGKRLLLNTHVDTVPPSEDQPNPFTPTIRDGAIYGRGSCDAKGQVATIWLAMAALKDLGARLGGDLTAHLVVEEEVGGNGTLAMARRGEKADGCIVLEPTEGILKTSIRGAVWFHIILTGSATHPGSGVKPRSALDMAIRVVDILKGYHARLLSESRGLPLFDKYENPMPLVVGRCTAGSWPATVPAQANLEGIIGLLPNRTARQVVAEITAAIEREGGPEMAGQFKVSPTYQHDSSVCPPQHALPQALLAAAAAAGQPSRVDAMCASCDACFYNNAPLNIPTVVYGGGSLGVAHSKDEHMPLAGLATAAAALANLAVNWCRSESK